MTLSATHTGLLRSLIGSALLLTLAGAAEWQSAAEKADELISKSRRIGGDEYALKAREVLTPWWDGENTPQKIRLQKATLLQRDHHFEEALTELNLALRQNPDLVEGWLMKSTILTVSGRYEEARRAAVPLFALGSPLLALTAGTAPTSCNGNLAESYELLKAAVEKHPDEAPGVRAWAHTALAEMAVRTGGAEPAGEHFRTALLLDPFSPYIMKSYANYMLGGGWAEDASELIEPHREHFPVLWMRIRKSLDAEPEEMKVLMSAYESSLSGKHRKHGHGPSHGHHHGHSHGRDEAVYYLEIKGDAREALHQAAGNWKSQREADDLLILCRAAIAAKSVATLAKAREWAEERHFEDIRLTALLEKTDR